MWEEVAVTGVDVDDFWLSGVENGVVYFFRWLGEPRATVLAVWSGDELHRVECRGVGDRLLPAAESVEIVGEVHQAFAASGISLAACGFA